MSNEQLSEFVDNVCGTSHLRVEEDYGDGYVRLRTSEAQRRQAIQDIRSSEDIVIELLRNARDSRARRVFIAIERSGAQRTIVCIDDGCGIPASMQELVFQPRVTSKLDAIVNDTWGIHGRGMALYSIAQNSKKHQVMCSEKGLGTSIRICTDLEALPEKTDQSTFPVIQMAQDAHAIIKGPRNIARTCAEFAIESRHLCDVYLGSAAEIAATLYALARNTYAAIERIFINDRNRMPFWARLSCAADPSDFAEIAAVLGLEMSDRTARRIMDGQIYAQKSLVECLYNHLQDQAIQTSQESNEKANHRKQRIAKQTLRLEPEDIELLKQDVIEDFAGIASKYYLNSHVSPSVKVSGESLTISIPLVAQ